MAQNPQLQQAIERIAKMDHAGVSADQIATAVNLPVGKIVEIQETEKYKAALAEIAQEAFDRVDVANQGWDMVENLAMNKVVEHLQRAPDPDYALKAAALANKAVRRGKHTNDTIGVLPNQQAIINVSLNFADKLQRDFAITPKAKNELIPKKDDNFLPPRQVTELLTQNAPKTIEQTIEDDIGDIGSLIPAFAGGAS